jgi:membrane-associated phospholipid phosphatase
MVNDIVFAEIGWRSKMNSFDLSVLHFLNHFVGRFPGFDELVGTVATTPYRGTFVVATIWWAWFRKTESQSEDRKLLLSGLVLTIFGLVIARGLAFSLPFRQRPTFSPELQLHFPSGFNPDNLIDWSSFPSDHAAFYFALATCIFLVSRKIGLLAFIYVFFVICVPRSYLGLHYPTDILAGMVIGIGIASLSYIKVLRESIARMPMRWLESSPGPFYAVFFIASILYASQFDPARHAIEHTVHALHKSAPIAEERSMGIEQDSKF